MVDSSRGVVLLAGADSSPGVDRVEDFNPEVAAVADSNPEVDRVEASNPEVVVVVAVVVDIRAVSSLPRNRTGRR